MSTPSQPGTKRVQCKQCLAMSDIPADADPHSVTFCGCCTEDHHHGENVLPADVCQENHPGVPCHGAVLGAPRPEGCTVCRPIIHYATTNMLTLVES